MNVDYNNNLLLARFAKMEDAEKAASAVKTTAKEKGVDVNNIALVTRPTADKIEIHETGDVESKKGAKIGTGVGAVIGLLAGPLGAVVGGAAGAAVGGLAAKFIDSGIPDKRLKELAQTLEVGSAAVIVVTGNDFSGLAERILRAAGGELEVEELANPVFARTDEANTTGTLPRQGS